MAAEDFKRKLTAVMSADVVGVKLLGVGAGTYFGEMASYMEMEDVLEGIYKSLSFGIIIP